MPIHQTLHGAQVPVHIFTDDIDAQACRDYAARNEAKLDARIAKEKAAVTK